MDNLQRNFTEDEKPDLFESKVESLGRIIAEYRDIEVLCKDHGVDIPPGILTYFERRCNYVVALFSVLDSEEEFRRLQTERDSLRMKVKEKIKGLGFTEDAFFPKIQM